MSLRQYFPVKTLCKGTHAIVTAVTIDPHKPPSYAKKEFKVHSRSGNICQVMNAKNEIFTLKMLDHPYIVKIVDCIITPLETSIILPLATSNLDDYVNKTLTPSLDTRLRYFNQIVSIACYLQHNKIIHSDLKLENFLYFEEEDEVRLCDLSFAFHPTNNPGTIAQATSPIINRAPETHRFLRTRIVSLDKVKSIDLSGSIREWHNYTTETRLTAELYSFGKVLLNIYAWHDFGKIEDFYHIDSITIEPFDKRVKLIDELLTARRIETDDETSKLIAALLTPQPDSRCQAFSRLEEYNSHKSLKVNLSFPLSSLPSEAILRRNDSIMLQAMKYIVRERNYKYMTIGLLDRVLSLIQNSIAFYMGSAECNGTDGFNLFVDACIEVSVFSNVVRFGSAPIDLNNWDPYEHHDVIRYVKPLFLEIVLELIKFHECSIVHDHFTAYTTDGSLILKCLPYYYTFAQHNGTSPKDYINKVRDTMGSLQNKYTPGTPLKEVSRSMINES